MKATDLPVACRSTPHLSPRRPMSGTSLLAIRLYVIILLGMDVVGPASAQSHQEKGPAAKGDIVLSSQLVKTGLYLIAGGGGNTLLRFSANGLILVDGKLPGTYRALMSQVRKINKLSDMPIR